MAENEFWQEEVVSPDVSSPGETQELGLLQMPETPASVKKVQQRRKWRPLWLALTILGGTALSIGMVEWNAAGGQGLLVEMPRAERRYDAGRDKDWFGFDEDDEDDAFFWGGEETEDKERAETTPALPSAPLGGDAALKISGAAEESLSLQQIYQKAIPSVVSIVGNRSTGTGIVFDANGYILTNSHVVVGNTEIEVRLQNGKTYRAALVGKDARSDLAVLKIEATGLQTAEFGDSDALQVGEMAVAIGDPLGVTLSGTMTDGIISAINRNVTVDGTVMTLIQTNAALNSGNSGGPLLNRFGQVVGINNMKMISLYDSVEGLGFAIPVTTAKPVVDEIIRTGRVQYAVLGIQVKQSAKPGQDEDTEGLLVVDVDTKSDAYQQGLWIGDRILRINGTPVRSIADLMDAKKGLAVGDSMVLSIRTKNGAHRELRIHLVDEDTLEDSK